MELLKQLLAADKVKVPNLEDEVRALGYDPTQLGEDDAMKLAGELKAKFAKSITRSSKKTTNQPVKKQSGDLDRSERTDRTPVISFDQAMRQAAHQSFEEVESVLDGVRDAKNRVATAKANEMLNEIADIPNATLSEFTKLAGDYKANPEFFRERGKETTNSILQSFGIE